MAYNDSALPIRNSDESGETKLAVNTLADGDVVVKLTDGTDILLVNADGSLNVNSTLQTGSNTIGKVYVTDGTDDLAVNADGSLNTNSTLQAGTAIAGKIYVTDGTEDLAINTDGSINVNVVDSVAGTPINDPDNTGTAIAKDGTHTHTYTVTTGKTFHLQRISASSSDKLQVEVKTGTSGSPTFLEMKHSSASKPDVEFVYPSDHEVAAGDVVELTITNRGNQAQDVFSTIKGYEI